MSKVGVVRVWLTYDESLLQEELQGLKYLPTILLYLVLSKGASRYRKSTSVLHEIVLARFLLQ